MRAELPADELMRLDALKRYDILDTIAEQSYDDITQIAAFIADTPISLISLVDRNRQWFKSKIGITASETPRDQAFCAHAILNPDSPLVVPDARDDPRFADNPLVTGQPDIRFYLGAPLVTHDHFALGTLCVIDRVPRTPSARQVNALAALARQVVVQLELRRLGSDLQRVVAEREAHLTQLEIYQQRLEEANAKLLILSQQDSLTGLANRGAFDKRLAAELNRAQRYEAPLSLLLIDVDCFKDYNDSFGHPAGDTALKTVARALGAIRPSDLLARYGGEEFAVVLPSTGGEVACVTAERLRATVAATAFEHRGVTISIGAATLTSTGTASTLLDAADKALYAAKARGRNRVVHADAL